MSAAAPIVPFYRVELAEDEIAAVVEVLRSGWLTTGARVREFERGVADYLGVRHGVAVNSCTAALHLALEAVGVRPGDHVLVPALTFTATAEVTSYLGAHPVFVDSADDTLCMDMDQVERAAAAAPGPVRALVPVHYAGQMADMFAARALADRRGWRLVADAAHTFPAWTRAEGGDWRLVGTFADVTCLSFYANKCITTGEGGMAVTNDEALARRMALMSLHGMDRDAWRRHLAEGSWYYEVVAAGFKYNLTDVAAALGLRQLARADQLWRRRQELARRYQRELADLDAVRPPIERPDRRHAWHLYVVRLDLDQLTIDRNRVIEELKARGVMASVNWMPLHLQPYWRDTYRLRPEQFPVATRAWREIVSLPLFPAMTDAEHARVCQALRDVCRAHRR